MVFISNGRTTCFGLLRPSSNFDSFLLKEISTSPRDLRVFCKTFSRKFSKSEDDSYRPKRV